MERTPLVWVVIRYALSVAAFILMCCLSVACWRGGEVFLGSVALLFGVVPFYLGTVQLGDALGRTVRKDPES